MSGEQQDMTLPDEVQHAESDMGCLRTLPRAIYYSLRLLFSQYLGNPKQRLSLIERLHAKGIMNDHLYLIARGRELYKGKRYEEAFTSWSIALHMKFSILVSWWDYVLAAFWSGHYSEALRVLDRRLQRHPRDADAWFWNIRACVLNELARYEEAIDSVDRALAINPQYVFALCTKGEILTAVGQYGNAIIWLEKAIQGKEYSAWKYLAVALRGLGREEEAQQAEAKGRAAYR